MTTLPDRAIPVELAVNEYNELAQETTEEEMLSHVTACPCAGSRGHPCELTYLSVRFTASYHGQGRDP